MVTPLFSHTILVVGFKTFHGLERYYQQHLHSKQKTPFGQITFADITRLLRANKAQVG